MTLRIWPDSLPTYTSYDLQVMDESLRMEMEVGTRRMRRVSLDRHELADVTWTMSNEEFELFRAWYADEHRSLVGDSEDLIGSGWATTNITASTQASAGPDADMATRLVDTATTAQHFVQNSFSTVPADNAQAILCASLKAAGRTWARVSLLTKAGTTSGAWINLNTGALGGNTTGFTPVVTDRGNGWQRLTIRANVGTGGTTPAMRINLGTGDGVDSYLGNNASGIDVCETMAKVRTTYDLPAKTDIRGFVQGAGGGAAWFSIKVLRGNSLTAEDARFVGPWKAVQSKGRVWSVTAKLELADNA